MSILEGKWALVTGASSGLGRDFAIELAKMKCNLVIVARREEKLKALMQHVKRSDNVDVEVIVQDLGQRGAPQELFDKVAAKNINIDVLINNAGFGCYGNFLDTPWEKEQQMLDLDIINLVHMTKLFIKGMVERKFGYVLQVASVAGFQPTPTYISYGAAKAYVLNFSEGLNFELKNTGVSVTALCPGATATEFFEASGQGDTLTGYQKMSLMTSEEVVKTAMAGLLKGKPTVVPGIYNKLGIFGIRFTPRKIVPMVASLLMKHAD